jgi:hypothetical protein
MAQDKKSDTIYVNGTEHEWPKGDDITYADVVKLDDPTYPQDPPLIYSVTYVRGQGSKPEGVLAPGAKVKVKEGMEFSVSSTGQS